VRAAASAVLLAAVVAVALGGSAGGARRAVPEFDHVLVIVLENKTQSQVLGNTEAPAFNRLARRYAVLSDYDGVTHPSLPNYLALISGSTHGVRSDCVSCAVSGRSLADTLARANLGWKLYAEGLPRAGFTGAAAGLYAKKHVPFLYFRNVLASPARRRLVVPLGRLSRDLATGALPEFSLIVPNLCHDMHSCSVSTGDRWLGRFLQPLLRSRKLRTSAVFVVTDESSQLRSRGPVPALALGPLVVPGSRFALPTSHYGLLRTIEDSWGLPRLAHSARARPITGIWQGSPSQG
jgi:phosphatidylinositol-3-phosphatase